MKPETTYQTVLGRLIAMKRRQKQMDQEELAQHVGVSNSTWSRIEAGLSALSIDQLAKAAEKLGTPVGELTSEADDFVRALLQQEGVEVYSSRDQANSTASGAEASGGVFLRGETLTATVAAMMRKKPKGPIAMTYKYRPDEGLDFLADVPSEHLEGLVALMIEDRNEELTDTEGYKRHHPDHNKYWREIATEIQTFGGNTFSNIYRGEGTIYREILHDVCDRLKVNYNKGSSIQGIEMNLLQKALADSFEKLDPDQRVEVLKVLGEKNATNLTSNAAVAAAQVLLRTSGFAAYKWSLIIVNGILKQSIGRGLSLGANMALTRTLSVAIGPVGWALTAAWTAYDLAGPAYRITVPSVLYVAALRLQIIQGKQLEQQEAE
ncbi:MAG: helix-turn-helix domain-containing protein [Rhodospirillaceae bacterium]|nr:helix-turn-helix domain-containing protein [Rhodospirillaceae bacterium]